MFWKILVPLDESLLAEQALGLAASLARASDATIDLALVRQIPPGAPKTRSSMDEADNYLETIVRELNTGAKVLASHTVLRGDPSEMICGRASDVGADLIVMTTHGRTGLSRLWLGSVAEGVVRHSTLPVVLVRPREKGAARSSAWPPVKQILVPLDGSNFAAEILPSASNVARTCGASLVLLGVVQPVPTVVVDPNMGSATVVPLRDDAATQCLVDEAERHLSGLVRKLRDDGIANAEFHVIIGQNVANEITQFASGHHADMIAMSTHGRGASRLLVGSVADKVRRSCKMPLLLRRPTMVREDESFLTARSIEQELPALSGAQVLSPTL